MIFRIILWLKCLIFSPFYLIYRFYNHNTQREDLYNWLATLTVCKYKYDFLSFVKLFATLREYRSLVLWRANMEWIPCPRESVHFVVAPEKIGSGIVLQHGFSSIIFPESIGENVQIWHNVTIGRKAKGSRNPRIGNNVKICAGAIVIGDIIVGDNAIIGAGSVVVKDVPSNTIVVGNPAKPINKKAK